MEFVKNTKQALKEVYERKFYFFLSFLMAFLTFSANAFIRNYKLIFSNFSFKLLGSLVFGTFQSMATSALVFLFLISILSGILVSFSVFLIKRQISSGLGIGASGVIIGLITPACPSCALGLLSLVGLGGFLTVLPFKGLEIGFVGILILLFSLTYLAKKIVTKTCEIK